MARLGLMESDQTVRLKPFTERRAPPLACETLQSELTALLQERTDLQAELGVASPPQKAGLATRIKALNKKIALKGTALDTCHAQNPSPPVRQDRALAFGWTGTVDTDLAFADFYAGDHSVVIRFLPQYPNAYEGPILAVNGTGDYLIGQGNAPQGADTHRNGNSLFVSVEGSSQEIALVLQANHWHHLAAVRSGNFISVYLDGALVGTPVPLTHTAVPAGLLRLGRQTPGVFVNNREAQFYGLLADLAVYSRALTAGEIATRSSSLASLAGTEPDLLAGWTFPSGMTGLPAVIQRAATLTGAVTHVNRAPGWNGAKDAALIPLPSHDVMHLPFVAGDAWAVAQGQAASWTHFGYAAFCLDFLIASPLHGPAFHAGDTYPNGTINAPLCAAGTGTVEVIGDRLPAPPKTTQLDTNLIEALPADGLPRAYLHLKKNSVRPYVGQVLYDGEPIAKASEFTGDLAHFHFAVGNLMDLDLDSQAWTPGFVTMPFAFDAYEVRQPDGSWSFVSRGIPQQGEVVRRTGPRLWLVEAAAASYVSFLVPTISFKLISQLRGRARVTIEVSANGGPFYVLRSEDPYNGAVPASLVGAWRGRMVGANSRNRTTLFWLGKTEGAKTFFDVNGRYRFRVSATDEDGYSADPVFVETVIRWHGERVSCVRIQGPPQSRRITAIGGTDADRGAWRLTTKDAVSALERGERFYVENRAGRRADLYVVDREDGRQFLSTHADAVQTNNLLNLPRCP